MSNLFRAIPAVDLCLEALTVADPGLAQAPRALLRELTAAFWEQRRQDIRAGRCQEAAALSLDAQLPALLAHVRSGLRLCLRPVLNATGVVIHTNMGRSVLAREAQAAVALAAQGYCNLELDLRSGGRGSRYDLVEGLICRLSGAEAALVVNNNAAAVLLVLDTFCKGGEVVVSRGELVEIGGSFRIPDVMEKSGAHLREVGATNRTHLRDYAAAINENTRALMRVHTSNYRIVGFHSAVSLPELAALARERRLPLIEDLGSGSFTDFSSCGLPNEPTVPFVLAQGADLATFSGDKALGGPQAGIIAGRKVLVDALKTNPLTRALRCDKLCLAALEATLRLYLDPEKARERIPTLRRIARPARELAREARALAARLRKHLGPACRVTLRPDVSRVGGGAFPQCDLPTTLVCLKPAAMSATALKTALLDAEPPLLGRLEEENFCLDPRTLERPDWNAALRVLQRALRAAQPIITDKEIR
ncbi:L-seryl-tRNA(Sec) selenium transferase [Desulfovibrio sp. ZJ200]|uniref:L-seryl-tRNA(Sec) selenium transferase n=1 Tax=Desulfovibrio sp. ZJ200 TaxID=2709792 RepID=UPI0013EB15FE|nr:L-seryl-tRNA(Sec) selenium transferase [Desulfovibrio sp. ZJ200]